MPMTEAEWQACTDPAPMLEFLRDKASDRKLRLFAVACCRNIGHLLTDRRSRSAVEAAERHADGRLSEVEFTQVRAAAHEAFLAAKLAEYDAEAEEDFCSTPRYNGLLAELAAAGAARATVSIKADIRIDVFAAYRPPDQEDQGEPERSQGCHEWAASARRRSDELLLRTARGYAASRWGTAAEAPSVTPQPAILRDLFGSSPFRATALPSIVLAWNDGTVRRIAEGIYEERAFDRLPILADALLDAGCDNEELLAHCRGAGPHVRGCWAVDLILGKS
jgi:hypothetical protein